MPVSLYGQSFKFSTYVSPLVSNYKIESDQIVQDELKIDLGFSTGFNSDYVFTKYFSMGTGIAYYFLRGEFYTPCFCGHTMDRNILTRNILSTHNIEIPLYLKLRLSKNENRFFYVQGGVAMNWLVSARRTVELETDFLNGEYINEEIAEETFYLHNKGNNSRGSSFQFGIGRQFPIKKINFYSEVAFRKDINYWNYDAYLVPSVVETFPIKNSSLLLKLGVLLKN